MTCLPKSNDYAKKSFELVREFVVIYLSIIIFVVYSVFLVAIIV